MRNLILSFSMLLGVFGCQSETPPPATPATEATATTPDSPQDHVLKTQIDALEKAKAVEDQLRQAAEQRDKQIDE